MALEIASCKKEVQDCVKPLCDPALVGPVYKRVLSALGDLDCSLIFGFIQFAILGK